MTDDPNKMTIPELKSVLSAAGIQIPLDKGNKAFYVGLYFKNIDKIKNYFVDRRIMCSGATPSVRTTDFDSDNDEYDEDDYYEYTDANGVKQKMMRRPKFDQEPDKKRIKKTDSNPFQSGKKSKGTKSQIVFNGANKKAAETVKSIFMNQPNK